MGSHAYSNIIFGVPVGNSYYLDENYDRNLDDLVYETKFEVFRHGHSECECTYYIGIKILGSSLSDDHGVMIDIPLDSSSFDSERRELIQLFLGLIQNPFNIDIDNIGIYLILSFDA